MTESVMSHDGVIQTRSSKRRLGPSAAICLAPLHLRPVRMAHDSEMLDVTGTYGTDVLREHLRHYPYRFINTHVLLAPQRTDFP